MAATSTRNSKTSYIFVGDMLTPVTISDTPPKLESYPSSSSSSMVDSMESGQKVPETPTMRPTGVKVNFPSTLIFSNLSGF